MAVINYRFDGFSEARVRLLFIYDINTFVELKVKIHFTKCVSLRFKYMEIHFLSLLYWIH